MTSQQAKELLPFIQAHADGKQLQFKEASHIEWREAGENVHFYPEWQFRIKPEPREFWIAFGHGVYESRENALRADAPPNSIIHVREVLD